MKIRINKIKLNEIPQAKRLLSITWIDTYSNLYSKDAIKEITSVFHDPKRLVEQAKSRDFYFGVAKIGGRIVGLTTVRRISKDIIFMNRLYVHPGFQRKGIGRKLMDRAVRHFKANKIKLEVEEKNWKGISFYKKSGFKKVRKKTIKVKRQKMPVILMEKSLR